MNQVDKPENTDPTPKPSDAEPSSYASWKQLSTVLSSIKASTDLSTSERDTLIQMITSEDPTLINTIRSCESQDLLSAQLLTLARSRLAGEANGTASTSSSSSTSTSTDTSDASSSSTSTTTEDVTMSTESDSTTIPSTPPTKSLATSASASSPPPTSPTEAAFKTALSIMSNDKKRYESCIKALYKTLTALKKKPGLITNRKMRMDNIAVKKMMEVPGASTFMETVGFTQTTPSSSSSSSSTDQKTPIYLQIEKEEDIRHDILDQAIEKLEHAIAIVEGRQTTTGEVKTPEPPKPSGPRVRCQGLGCNFFGDESTENLCSVCYKKKYFGTPTSTSMTPTTPVKAPVVPLVTVLRCKSGCGFVGIESYGGQCSVCYKKDKEGKEPPKRWRRHLHSASIKLRAIRLFNAGKRPAQTNKHRCYTCGKRVGITGIECRCSYIFCGKHRYPQEHECPFDYKNLQRKKLAKENEMITRKKMDKIGE